MPKKYPAGVRARAVRMAVDQLPGYPTVFATCKALAPKLSVGVETLRKLVVQAQIDAGVTAGPTTIELEEIKKLKAQNRDLRESNEILKAASIFFSSGSSTPATTDLCRRR